MDDDFKDLGFGAEVARRSRERLLNRDGTFNVVRDGLDPVSALGMLREREPVSRLTMPLGLRGWLVTGYDESKTVLAADPETFSNDFGNMIGKVGIAAEQDPGGLGFTAEPFRVACPVPLDHGTALFAAVHDDDTHVESFVVDPSRPANGHLAFGHGSHRCVGAELARMELRLAYPALVRRFPNMRLGVPPDELAYRISRASTG